MPTLPRNTVRQVEDAVRAFEDARSKFETDATNLQNRLLSNPDLKKLIHSLKWRAKDPAHLRDKLLRKARDAAIAGKPFRVTADNLFDLVPDLAGVRLLHLHMRQMEEIHPLIMQVLATEGYVMQNKPEAKTWDPEYKAMFLELGLKVQLNESLYTSVHYVIKQNKTTRRLCELQVRTLAEEIWGEVSHTINYPHETDSIACREQLKVLARFVSGCSRLVDSIAVSLEDHCRMARSATPLVRRGKRPRSVSGS
jgi:ppGpp synthetase/RelA/SpoT-type nucleotidyltranferase